MTPDRLGSDAELLERIQRLRSILPALAAEVAMARREGARLRRENTALQHRVAELEGRAPDTKSARQSPRAAKSPRQAKVATSRQAPPVTDPARRAQAMKLRLWETDRREPAPSVAAPRPSRRVQQSLQ